MFGDEQADLFRSQDAVALRLGAVETVEDETVRRSDGSLRRIQTRKVALSDSPGARPRYVLGVCEDVTDRKASEERLAHLAHHDALTGLPNRFLFHDRLASALSRVGEGRERIAVLCVTSTASRP